MGYAIRCPRCKIGKSDHSFAHPGKGFHGSASVAVWSAYDNDDISHLSDSTSSFVPPNSIQQTPTSPGGAAQAFSQDVQLNKSKNKNSRALVKLKKSSPTSELPHDSGVPSQDTSSELSDAKVLVLVIQGDRRVFKIDLPTVVSCGSRGGGRRKSVTRFMIQRLGGL